MRRDFILPEQDSEFLDASGYKWDTIKESNCMWMIINDWLIPDGYNVKRVNLALQIPAGYPVAQIDMAYFYPHLIRIDNILIKALTQQPITNIVYQRWSRHRTGENAWRPGLDDISTHLQMVFYWLERELKK